MSGEHLPGGKAVGLSITPLEGVDTTGLAEPNKGEPELIVTKDADSAAQTAAERIADALIAAVDERGRADFCTTGGSTPIPIYRLLARSPLRDRIPWQLVHFWWGDDRFVPRDHPESNVTSLDDVLLARSRSEGMEAEGAPLPAANVHPFPVTQALAENRPIEWSAGRYAEEMARSLPLASGNWPVFDLILVGVGPDGHVLSCFPDSPAFDTMAWTLAIPAPTHLEPHLPRVTLNPRILDASPVMAAAWGAGKAEAVGHIFGPVRDDHRWPAQRTRREGAIWIVDEAAAARMPKG